MFDQTFWKTFRGSKCKSVAIVRIAFLAAGGLPRLYGSGTHDAPGQREDRCLRTGHCAVARHGDSLPNIPDANMEDV